MILKLYLIALDIAALCDLQPVGIHVLRQQERIVYRGINNIRSKYYALKKTVPTTYIIILKNKCEYNLIII